MVTGQIDTCIRRDKEIAKASSVPGSLRKALRRFGREISKRGIKTERKLFTAS